MRPPAILTIFVYARSGAAILEFAIALPILLMLVAGAYEIGRAALVYLAMQSAVQGGARALARLPDPDCRPTCSAAAKRTIEAATDEIAGRTGIAASAIRVAPSPASPPGTIVLAASVQIGAAIFGGIGLPAGWTLTVSHQEPRLAP